MITIKAATLNELTTRMGEFKSAYVRKAPARIGGVWRVTLAWSE